MHEHHDLIHDDHHESLAHHEAMHDFHDLDTAVIHELVRHDNHVHDVHDTFHHEPMHHGNPVYH